MSRRTLVFLIVFFCCVFSLAWGQTDIIITGTSAYTVLGRGLAWGSPVNNNFIFQPLNPNVTVCVYVTNNNPSSAHTFTVALQQTGDPQVKGFSSVQLKWGLSQTVQSFPVTVNPSSTVGVDFNVTAAALLTAQFSGTTAAGGTPDTADIFAVQTTAGTCGIANPTPIAVRGPTPNNTIVPLLNQFPIAIGGYDSGNTLTAVGIGTGFSAKALYVAPTATSTTVNAKISSTYNMTSSASGSAMVGQATFPFRPSGLSSDVLAALGDEVRSHVTFNQTFYTSTSNSAPGANTMLLHMFCSICSVGIFPAKAYVSCQATTPTNCDIEVLRTTTVGTTCAANPVTNNGALGNAVSSALTVQTGCTAGAATVVGSTIVKQFIASNTTAVIDLGGFYISSSQNGGILFRNPTAITTGIINIQLAWVEE